MIDKYKQPYLQPYTGRDSRVTCPNCKKPHSFTLYLDGETGQPIAPTVGKCNHENSCGYHYTPKRYFIDNPEMSKNRIKPIWFNQFKPIEPIKPIKPIGYIPDDYVKKSLSTESDFVQFLKRLFENSNGLNQSIDEVCNMYRLGATKDRRVIFWQIDFEGKVRTGKIMAYNPETGKRVHDQSGAIDWVHNKLKRTGELPDDFNLVQCYFGEHLLSANPHKTVAIVESEKTAIIASLFMPEYVWLAAGNLNGLTVEKSKVLRGRSVILFPDLSKELPTRPTAFELWRKRAAEIRQAYGCKVYVSDYLEKIATDEEKENGFDIADYFLKLELRSLRSRKVNKDLDVSDKSETSETSETSEVDAIQVETDELERWFSGVQLPPDILKGKYLSVCYPRLFVKEAFKAIKSNNGNVERLWEILFEMKDITQSGLVSIN